MTLTQVQVSKFQYWLIRNLRFLAFVCMKGGIFARYMSLFVLTLH